MAVASNATGTGRPGIDLLGIYLNDHLAGAAGGAELARRVAGSRSAAWLGEKAARLKLNGRERASR